MVGACLDLLLLPVLLLPVLPDLLALLVLGILVLLLVGILPGVLLRKRRWEYPNTVVVPFSFPAFSNLAEGVDEGVGSDLSVSCTGRKSRYKLWRLRGVSE